MATTSFKPSRSLRRVLDRVKPKLRTVMVATYKCSGCGTMVTDDVRRDRLSRCPFCGKMVVLVVKQPHPIRRRGGCPSEPRDKQ